MCTRCDLLAAGEIDVVTYDGICDDEDEIRVPGEYVSPDEF